MLPAHSPPTPRPPDPAAGSPFLYTSNTSDQQNINAGFINSQGENRSYILSGNRVFLLVLLVLFYFLKLILVSPQFSVILCKYVS